jgi:hypothetical protein
MLGLMTIENFAQFNGAFTEAYEIEHRYEIVGSNSRRYRLDVFRDVGSKPQSYSVQYYVEKEIVISGTAYKIWVSQELPHAEALSADAALDQGMGFLADMINEK